MLVRCSANVMLALGCVTLVLVLAPTVCLAAESNSTIPSSSVLLDRLNATLKSDNKTSSVNSTGTAKNTKFIPTLHFPFKLFNKTSHKNETQRNNKTLTTTTVRPQVNSSSSLFHKRAINSTIAVADLKNATQSLKNATSTSRLDTTHSSKNATNTRLLNATENLSSSAKLSITSRLNATSNSNSTDSPIEHLNSTVAHRFGSIGKNETANATSSAVNRLNGTAAVHLSSIKSVVNSSSNAKPHITKRAVDLDNKTKSDNVSAKSFISVIESIPSVLLNSTSDVTKWAKDLVMGKDEEEHPARAERSVNATTKSDNSTVRPSKESKLVSNASTKADVKVDKLLDNTTISSQEANANASRNSSSHVHRRDAFYGAPQQYQQPQLVPVYTTTPAPVYPAYPSYPSYQTTEGPYDAMAVYATPAYAAPAYAAPGVPYAAPSYAPPAASYAVPTYGPAYGQQAPVSESYYTAPVPAYTTTAPYSYVVPQKPAQASYRPPQLPAYVEPPRPYAAAPPVPQSYAPQPASYAEPPKPYAVAPSVPQTYVPPSTQYVQQPSGGQPGAPPASATLSPWF